MSKQNISAVSTKRALLTSFAVGISDVLINAVVAVLTGSVVMVAESLQGLADLTSVSFLLVGDKRATKRSTKRHPFGYGKEQYFWTLLAAFLILSLTASLSFYFGLKDLSSPGPITNIYLAYVVLVWGALSNGYAFTVSARRILEGRPFNKLWKTFFDSHLVAPKTTYILDLMGTLAAIFGLAALVIFQLTGYHSLDGLGAMAIGLMLGVFAVVLLFSLKNLITGQSAPPGVERRIRKAALEHPAVEEVLDLRTMIIGADKVLVNLEVHLKANLTTNDIEQDIDEIKELIQQNVPDAYHIQIELETPDHELTK